MKRQAQYDIEAEQNVLAFILSNPAQLRLFALEPWHFFDPWHQAIMGGLTSGSPWLGTREAKNYVDDLKRVVPTPTEAQASALVVLTLAAIRMPH